MDCCFNLQIPKSSPGCVVLWPSSKTFLSGMAESYQVKYDNEQMKGYLTSNEFSQCLNEINNATYSEFPCPGCMLFGYCCCPCTAGLSLFLPGRKARLARIKVEKTIHRLNSIYSRNNRQIKFKLVFKCSTSWIEVILPSHPTAWN